jgi:hypothetical protein
MSPDAKTLPRLLYLSDLGGYVVHVYRFPSLNVAGKLTGFIAPQGLCTDARGNVWVTDTLTYQIIKFAHGGTKRLATLADPVGMPAGCAVDPTSGNLAVTNVMDFSGAASVLVYTHARGTPLVYGNPAQAYDYFAAYDANGDLYVSGSSPQAGYALSVLAHGTSSLSIVKVAGATIYFPGTVAWKGSTLMLGDQTCKNTSASCLYKATVSGKTVHITGSISLGGSCDVAQVWVGAAQIVGGNDEANCRYGRSTVDRWPDAGGKPLASRSGVRMPVGVTVSERSAF